MAWTLTRKAVIVLTSNSAGGLPLSFNISWTRVTPRLNLLTYFITLIASATSMGHKMKRIFLRDGDYGRKGLWVWKLWAVVGLAVEKTKRIKSLHRFMWSLHESVQKFTWVLIWGCMGVVEV